MLVHSTTFKECSNEIKICCTYNITYCKRQVAEIRKAMTDKLNVLFICADQWRADCISALGHPNVKTPNLDALVKDGMLFRNHFGQCTPCGPSRTSLLTGLYLMNHRSGRNGTP